MQKKIKLPIVYNVVIEGKERQVEINWGNSPNWINKFRDDLDNAMRISLIPKKEFVGKVPVVSVYFGDEDDNREDKQWIVGSKVFGRINKGTDQCKEMRVYFLGWKQTIRFVDGTSTAIKSIHWVYPGGAVECAPAPTLVDYFLKTVGG